MHAVDGICCISVLLGECQADDCTEVVWVGVSATIDASLVLT